jgi:demethylmenaquinone methyltransferase/2-methoxy-6-polyprenyl-1,4-benzoquinol methylase
MTPSTSSSSPTAPASALASPASASPAWSADDLARNPHEDLAKAERVERMFTAIARSYDLNNRLHSFGRDVAWRRTAVTLAQVQPTDDVLDVACGTGDLSEAFCRGGARSVTGVDFTQAMLDIASMKAARRLAGRAIRYEWADATALPFAAGSFDVVSIAFGIRNVADPAKALSEFRRVLRPGGRVVVLEFGEPRNRALRALNRLYTHRIMPLTATLIARDRSGAYRYLPRSVETFLTPERLAGALGSAGFRVTRQRSMTFGVCVATVAEARPAGTDDPRQGV